MGKFGWSLPPGVTQRMIDEAFGGDEGPCECCGRDPADCICPECPICHEQGNLKCYEGFGHGHMEFSREQMIGQSKLRIHRLKEQITDEELALQYLEQGEEQCND